MSTDEIEDDEKRFFEFFDTPEVNISPFEPTDVYNNDGDDDDDEEDDSYFSYNMIEDNLYLSDISTATSRKKLQSLSIRRIITVETIPIDLPLNIDKSNYLFIEAMDF